MVRDIETASRASVELPQGYNVEYGGQVESESDAARTSRSRPLVIMGIFLVLFAGVPVGSRAALLVMVNLPLA